MIRKIVVWIVTNAVALGVAAWLVPGITFTGSTKTSDRIVQILLVGAVFGVINAFVKPAVKLFSFPLIILSLGLMLIVINALMLWLTSWASGKLNLDFHVDGFVPALLGSLIISLVSWGLHLALDDD